MSSKAIYLRVSRDDLDESKQKTAILHKYKIRDYSEIKEKLSAYAEEKQELRTEFQRLKTAISNQEITDVYIYSVERLERNIIRLFEFFFFCEAHECRIHSVMQDIPNREPNETPMQTFLRYVNVLLFGYKGQEESYTISYRTKQAFEKHNNNTFSYKGNKVGKQFTSLDGDKITITAKKLNQLQTRITKLIDKYESTKTKGYYPYIIDTIEKEYNIKLSKAYISIHKNGRYNK